MSMPAWWEYCVILYISSQLVSKRYRVGGLKVSTVGVFTAWKSEDATDWGMIHSFVNCLDTLSSKVASSQMWLHCNSHSWWSDCCIEQGRCRTFAWPLEVLLEGLVHFRSQRTVSVKSQCVFSVLKAIQSPSWLLSSAVAAGKQSDSAEINGWLRPPKLLFAKTRSKLDLTYRSKAY